MIAVTATALALAGCSADAPDTDEPAAHGADDGADTSAEGQATDDTASGGVLDSLEAPALHTDVEPADPGTAYIEIDGARLELAINSCDLISNDDGDRYIGLASGDTVAGPTELRWDRSIGDGNGWAWIDEYVQLSIATDVDGTTLMSNSMIQLEQDQDGTVRWDSGSAAELPVLRVQGPLATAAGTIDAVPFAEEPLTGEFIASMHCG